MKTFTFSTSKRIYDYLTSGKDLYCVDDEIYMFEYSYVGSIAYYYLSYEELMDLANEVSEYGEYIGSALGPGGYIIDPDGRDEYDDDIDKLDYEPIYDFLDQFVGKKFISADADDLVGNKVTESCKKESYDDYDDVLMYEVYFNGSHEGAFDNYKEAETELFDLLDDAVRGGYIADIDLEETYIEDSDGEVHYSADADDLVGNKVTESYYRESIDRSDCKIKFSKKDYNDLQSVVAEGTDDEDYWDFFGTIEIGSDPDEDLFAIDIVARYPDDKLVGAYDIYRVYSKDLYDDIDNDNFASGYLNLSLSYEDQLDFLISKLKAASNDYLSMGD